jgi:putative membrane protein
MKILWLGCFFGVLLWSAIEPKDRITWWLEVAPALIALVVMVLTWHRFRLTRLLYGLILLHSIVLMIGGHYTYAEVPLGDWLQPLLGSERNNYDKLGHFMQGLVPAMVAREILLRNQVLAAPGWLNAIVVSICLAISALYELIEWLVALISGASSEAFLGTQGYIWDTQTDIAMALLGAVSGLLLLSAKQDRQIAALNAREHAEDGDSGQLRPARMPPSSDHLAPPSACARPPAMAKSTALYWNVLASEHAGRWQPVAGTEGMLEELTLAFDEHSGDYTRLTRFKAGADTRAFGSKVHDYPEEIYIISGRLYDAAFDFWLESGHYASRPPGEWHGPFCCAEECLVLEVSYPSQAIGSG